MANIKFAKYLRKNLTEAESLLWFHLRRKQIEGYKFRHQSPIGPYVVDFVCFEKMLVIEVDGGQHQVQKAYDEKRTHYLEKQGFQVLRYWNHQVLTELDVVLEEIRRKLLD